MCREDVPAYAGPVGTDAASTSSPAISMPEATSSRRIDIYTQAVGKSPRVANPVGGRKPSHPRSVHRSRGGGALHKMADREEDHGRVSTRPLAFETPSMCEAPRDQENTNPLRMGRPGTDNYSSRPEAAYAGEESRLLAKAQWCRNLYRCRVPVVLSSRARLGRPRRRSLCWWRHYAHARRQHATTVPA